MRVQGFSAVFHRRILLVDGRHVCQALYAEPASQEGEFSSHFSSESFTGSPLMHSLLMFQCGTARQMKGENRVAPTCNCSFIEVFCADTYLVNFHLSCLIICLLVVTWQELRGRGSQPPEQIKIWPGKTPEGERHLSEDFVVGGKSAHCQPVHVHSQCVSAQKMLVNNIGKCNTITPSLSLCLLI